MSRRPFYLRDFVRESNAIEGIYRTRLAEVEAHEQFLALPKIEVGDVANLVSVLQPGAVLRDRAGLNVRVGRHIAPPGAPEIRDQLAEILTVPRAEGWEAASVLSYHQHHAYETLHPFTDGNGRSGRAFWLWCMGGIERAPLGFLHHWYYQSLEHRR